MPGARARDALGRARSPAPRRALEVMSRFAVDPRWLVKATSISDSLTYGKGAEQPGQSGRLRERLGLVSGLHDHAHRVGGCAGARRA